MSELNHLKESIKDLNLLYIEENSKFRETISESLSCLFESIFVAVGEKEGLESFKLNHSQVVIIDVETPALDWIKIAQHISDVKPETKVIVLSKYDDVQSLHSAIDVGVMKFLSKPVDVDMFLDAIELAVHKLKIVEDEKLFYSSLDGMFNYKETMVMMLEDNKPLLANQLFLDFFDVECVEEFNNKHKNLGALFLKHEGFLYNHDDVDWINEVQAHDGKLFHVKMKSIKEDIRHFLFKYHKNPKKTAYVIVSFYDVTDLDFAELFDKEELSDKSKFDDKKNLFQLLELIQKNNIKVHLYNYYKGLTIINDATIEEVKDGTITLKTDFIQQKAINHESKTLISSEVLPTTVSCDMIVRNTYEKQSVKVKNIHYSHSSPVKRQTIRLLPDDKYTISLFVKHQTGKYKSRIVIEDISLKSIKLRFSRLPTDIKENDSVVIDMVFDVEGKPLIINTDATMFKQDDYSIIFLLKLNKVQKKNMLKYLTSRQIEIIKEFRVLQK